MFRRRVPHVGRARAARCGGRPGIVFSAKTTWPQSAAPQCAMRTPPSPSSRFHKPVAPPSGEARGRSGEEQHAGDEREAKAGHYGGSGEVEDRIECCWFLRANGRERFCLAPKFAQDRPELETNPRADDFGDVPMKESPCPSALKTTAGAAPGCCDDRRHARRYGHARPGLLSLRSRILRLRPLRRARSFRRRFFGPRFYGAGFYGPAFFGPRFFGPRPFIRPYAFGPYPFY